MRIPVGREAMASANSRNKSPEGDGGLPELVAQVPRDLLRTFPHTKRVGNYLLGRTLGEGSFAKVKEALHTLTGEKVAVKVIDKKKAREDAYVRKNLRREGKLLQLVRHPHVIQLYEILETENSYYLVTELCRGGDLMDFICNRKKLEERDTRRFIRQILLAVDYLHSVGILHRDLKVENLLLDENRNIKIIDCQPDPSQSQHHACRCPGAFIAESSADFGLSNAVRVSHSKSGTSFQEFCVTQCGSPAYAAPELLGNKKYGPKVDVWSIGVNMYAMLTGTLPYTVDPFNIKALYNKMLNGDMNAIPQHLTTDCKDLLCQFLRSDPEKRISIQAALQHPWITESRGLPLGQVPFPNRLLPSELNEDILRHMAHNLDFRMSEIIRLVSTNVPNNATATYFLFYRKLQKYEALHRVRGKVAACEPPRMIPKSAQASQESLVVQEPLTTKSIIELLPIAQTKPTGVADHETQELKDMAPDPRINNMTNKPRPIPTEMSPAKRPLLKLSTEKGSPGCPAKSEPERGPQPAAADTNLPRSRPEQAETTKPAPPPNSAAGACVEDRISSGRVFSARPTTSGNNGNMVGEAELPTIKLRTENRTEDTKLSSVSPSSSSRRVTTYWNNRLTPRTIPQEQDGRPRSGNHSPVPSLSRRLSPRDRPEHMFSGSPQSEKRLSQTLPRAAQAPKKKSSAPDNGQYDRFARRSHNPASNNERSRSHKLISAHYTESRTTRSPSSPRRLSPSRFKRKGSVETLGPSFLTVGGDQGIVRTGSGIGRGVVRRKSYETPLIRGSRSPSVLEEWENEKFASSLASQMPLSDRSSSSARDCQVTLPAISPPLIRKHQDGGT